MHLRLTAVVAALALVAAAVVVLDPFREQDEPGAGRPWFYRIAPEEIESIEILHGEGHVRFLRVSESAFVFVDPPGLPPDRVRFSGVPLLVSGPRAKRELPLDSAASGLSDQYGLDDPRTVVRVGVAGKEDLEFRLGRETSDGAHQYGQVSGVAALHLIASSWGEVLARLAEEPPLPKWYVKRSPEEIVELNLYRDGPRPDVPPSLRFNKSEGAWTVGRGVGETARPVDAERWSDLLPLLSGAPAISVIALEAGEARYGFTGDPPAIELRFLNESPRGTPFVDSVRWSIGGKTPDGLSYYAMVDAEGPHGPVLSINAEWTETLLRLVDKPPYAEDR